MSATGVVLAALAGAVIGLGVGGLCVLLERVERLRQEDEEDRIAYERDVAAAQLAAAEAGTPIPTAEPWPREPLGWSWREWGLAPALGALGFASFAAHESMGRGLLIHLLWVTVLVQIVVFDLKHRLILNRVTYPAMALALALAQVSPGLTFVHALVGAAAVGIFFLLMNVISRGGIGLGDAKLGALVGGITGIGGDLNHLGAVYAVIYAIFLGGAAALLLLILRVRGLKDPIPYGPFLCVGAGIILYQGP